METKKRILIRYKWCKTAILFYLDFLLVVSAAFYLETLEYQILRKL